MGWKAAAELKPMIGVDAVGGCALWGEVVLWGGGVADGAGAVQACGDPRRGGPEPR